MKNFFRVKLDFLRKNFFKKSFLTFLSWKGNIKTESLSVRTPLYFSPHNMYDVTWLTWPSPISYGIKPLYVQTLQTNIQEVVLKTHKKNCSPRKLEIRIRVFWWDPDLKLGWTPVYRSIIYSHRMFFSRYNILTKLN